jgi:hypothetical protein
LLRVRGITPALFYGSEGRPGLRDVFSAIRVKHFTENSRRVNMKSAINSPAVLQALIGDTDAVNNLLSQVNNPTGTGPGSANPDGGDPLAMVQGLFLTNSGGLKAEEFIAEYEPEVVMVEARADAASERNQARIAALVDLGSEANDVQILQWFDRAPWDGALPGLPAAAPETHG